MNMPKTIIMINTIIISNIDNHSNHNVRKQHLNRDKATGVTITNIQTIPGSGSRSGPPRHLNEIHASIRHTSDKNNNNIFIPF